MSKPIKTTSSKIDAAPTPHNTPSSVLTGSYLKNGNPARSVPQTIKEEDITSALANNPQLLASIQDKLGDLVGQDSGYVASLPHAVRDRIYALKKLQRDLFELEKDFQLEMFALEEKYLQKYSPVHQRRYEITSGKQEPSLREIEIGKQLGDELDTVAEEAEEDEDEEGQDKIKGIPSFWLTAFENLPMVSQTVTSADAEVLECLTDVRLEYLTEGKPGFKLVFQFDEENPYFTNKELVKTYFYQSELGYSGDFIYDHAEGCEIKWTDNESNVTVSVEKRKQRNKTTKQVRTIEKITPVESFFNFFDPPKVPAKKTNESEVENAKGEEEDGHDSEDDDEEDPDEVAELESRLALDYAIGEEFKDKLVPRAVDWFTGAAIEFEYDADEGEDEDAEFDSEFDDEEDEDEDDDDDGEDDDENADDSEEDSDPSDFKPAGSNSKEQPPECKQA
ncbi:LAFA_0G05710g1_1 [Lachancea sp. 'fantastica']|nr:LAFA_0G05710g1_1 [Lachancea sp. 'fantastica']